MFYIKYSTTPRAARGRLAREAGAGGGASAVCGVGPRAGSRGRAGETGERNKISKKKGLYTSPIVCVECELAVCALWTLLLELKRDIHVHHGSDSPAHSSDSSPYLRLSARSTMASWMALATSRDVGASVLLRGQGVGLTKTSMCFGVSAAHAGYLPGSQGMCGGPAGRPASRTGAIKRKGGRADQGEEIIRRPRLPPRRVPPRSRRARVGQTST